MPNWAVYVLMNEPKCRVPSLSASHVSSLNTAQIGCRSRAKPEFQNYVQVMFRPIIRTDKYVERQYTIFITMCETSSMPSSSQINALKHVFRQLE